MQSAKTHGMDHTIQLRVQAAGRGNRPHFMRCVETASTPALAVMMAVRKAEFKGLRVLDGRVDVSRTFSMSKRCSRCQAIIFDGAETRNRDGFPRCWDCA